MCSSHKFDKIILHFLFPLGVRVTHYGSFSQRRKLNIVSTCCLILSQQVWHEMKGIFFAHSSSK